MAGSLSLHNDQSLKLTHVSLTNCTGVIEKNYHTGSRDSQRHGSLLHHMVLLYGSLSIISYPEIVKHRIIIISN